ncbi:dienelactone hydrolase family protein [Bradyrhizobium sp.]|uniref:dienelactone hydrolase family protein n=1 Tax=Bradyrhizobium sp. TaxID=376 RepID=UPI004037981D
MIELTTGDGQKLSAYRADPDGAPKGAVVVVQEIFGVNPHIRKMADMFAAKGYVAIAPSLFDPVKADVGLGYDEAGVSEGLHLVKEVGRDRALAEIQAAVDSVKEAGKVAVVGYDWGGYLAYAAANRVNGVACAVGYYGGGIVDDYGEKRKVPTLLHFAEDDKNIPPEAVVQFRAFRPDVSAFSYPGAVHGFNCDERGDHNQEAADKALERTLFWVSQYVEGQPPILLKNSGAYAQAKVDKKKKKKSAGGDDLGPPMD